MQTTKKHLAIGACFMAMAAILVWFQTIPSKEQNEEMSPGSRSAFSMRWSESGMERRGSNNREGKGALDRRIGRVYKSNITSEQMDAYLNASGRSPEALVFAVLLQDRSVEYYELRKYADHPMACAVLFSRETDPSERLALADRFLKNNPNNAFGYLMRANALLASGRCAEASEMTSSASLLQLDDPGGDIFRAQFDTLDNIVPRRIVNLEYMMAGNNWAEMTSMSLFRPALDARLYNVHIDGRNQFNFEMFSRVGASIEKTYNSRQNNLSIVNLAFSMNMALRQAVQSYPDDRSLAEYAALQQKKAIDLSQNQLALDKMINTMSQQEIDDMASKLRSTEWIH